jgi:hypothetical protein
MPLSIIARIYSQLEQVTEISAIHQNQSHDERSVMHWMV